jgi:hypothetical protein
MTWRYWRCRTPSWLDWFWPLFGHCIRIADGYAYCDRCPWRERLPL